MNPITTESPTGQPVELGRYQTPKGGRVLIGRRLDGMVHVFDAPQSRMGRCYFVEGGFESKAELAVLLADYRRQAELLGACPMSREAIDRAFAPPAAEPSPPQLGTPTGVRGPGIGSAAGGALTEGAMR